MSLLNKCISDPSVIVPFESLEIHDNLSYEKILVEILDHHICRLRNKEVALVKVLWQNQSVEGANCEAEADMQTKYPYLFGADSDSDLVKRNKFS